MDENFNSLAEEQKEPSGAAVLTKKNVSDKPNHTKELTGEDRHTTGFADSPIDVNHPSLEKLAELTAVMSRFELDVVTAATPSRTRASSEPTPAGRIPKTVVMKSCEHVNENLPDVSTTTDESSSFSGNITPPTASSEKKKRIEPLPSPFIYGGKISYEDRRGLYRHLQEQWRGHMATASVSESRHRSGYMWSGELPPRNYNNPTFSSKIFVGGVPWDITESALTEAFSPYGACRVEWPCKEVRSHSNQRNRGKVTGYVYIVFETERSVKSLLQDCSQEFGSAGEWYFKIKARRNQTSEIRQVQVIPWVVSDSSYIDDPSCRLDPKKTVFVGALHGMITAHVLFSIMNELYGNVVFVGIDTDKYKYPIGSGRVTFRSHTSYFNAIESAFLEIRTSKFSKKVQIDPFLEDSWCMVCCENPGPYFCRDRTCFRYYCVSCWQIRHAIGGKQESHRPLTRHAPRSIAPRIDNHGSCVELCKSSPRCYLPTQGNVPAAPLGGMAAVAAVARGTVPRQQRHAYQYMQLAPAYTATLYTPAVVQQQCRVGTNAAPAPMITTNQPVSPSSPYIQQRLY